MPVGFRFWLLCAAVVALSLGTMLAAALAQGGGIVRGAVVNEAGEPIAGATVKAENPELRPPEFIQTTNENGRFQIIGLQSGSWNFTIEADGFHPNVAPATIRYGENPPMTFELRRIRHPLELALGEEALAGIDPVALQEQLNAADELFNSQQYEQAIVAYQAILAKLPALTNINLRIGHAYRATKQYDEALAAYQEVLDEDPENEEVKTAIGMVNLESGNLEAAGETLQAAAEGDAPREVLYNLGELAFAKNEVDEAAQWYEKAHTTDPTWGKPIFKLALVALNKGDTETAAKYFEQVVEVDPDSPEAAQAKAVLQQLKP